jgi:hypothetical protein
VVAGNPDELRLHLPGVGQLRPPARAKLEELALERTARALGEAGRLEAEWRSDPGAEPEITARDIADAFRFADRVAPKKLSLRQRVFDVVAFAAAFIGGVFGNAITTPVGAVGFAISVVVGVVAYLNRGAP